MTSCTRWDPHALANQLGVALPDPKTLPVNGSGGLTVEPINLDGYPQVQTALDKVSAPPDRSVDTMRILRACADAGLTLAQGRWVVHQRPDLKERLAKRNDDDVQTAWLKIMDSRQTSSSSGETFTTSETGDEWVGHTAQLGFAYRLAAGWRHKLLYVHGIGWYYWDGKRWAYDDIGAAQRAVYALLKALWRKAHDDKELAKAISRCETATGVAGILTLARALPEFAATVRDLDADPYLLNCANGTLDLRTIELLPHNPADRITKVTRGAYHPDTLTFGRWQKFLTEVLPGEDVRAYLQRLVGLALLGRVAEHLLPILTGTGANGKGTWYKALLYALGDYAGTAEPDLFMNRQGAHPTGEMDLMGMRFIVVSESQKGRDLDEAKMKRLTGGDTVRARRMHKDFIEFEPSHLAILITNHLPKVSGDDLATWRRLRVIPFDVVIPPENRDPHLDEQLEIDADAVLAWALAGWRDYVAREEKLDEPDAVLVATDTYRKDSDTVERFIAEECVTTSAALKATTSQLYEKWRPWAAADGAPELSLKAFGQALDRHGYTAGKPVNGKRWREGIGPKVVEE